LCLYFPKSCVTRFMMFKESCQIYVRIIGEHTIFLNILQLDDFFRNELCSTIEWKWSCWKLKSLTVQW
jgi:hypothetical protein